MALLKHSLKEKLDDQALQRLVAGKWETLLQATSDTQTVAMLSLNRARRDNTVFLTHEHVTDPLFLQMPQLLEFKNDKVESQATK